MTKPTSRARRSPLLLLATLTFAFLLGAPQTAAAADAAWHRTGYGVMRTHVAFMPVEVFSVGHDMKCVPEHKSKADVIAAECDKRFVWRALRDLDKDDVRATFREAYRSVDYRDAAKVERALSIFTTGIKDGASVTISYDAATQRTTFAERRGPTIHVTGENFMKATWSVIFANREMRELSDALVSKLETAR